MDWFPILAIGSSGGGGAQQEGGWSSLLFLFSTLLFIWWFIYLNPQIKRQKERDKLLEGVKKGDRIVTRGGMLGTVVGVKEKEKVVVLKIAENVKIEIVRGAIETILTGNEAIPQDGKKDS